MQDDAQTTATPTAAGTGLLTRGQAAQFLTDNGFPIVKGTLAVMASTGTPEGPPFRRWHRKALYDPADLLAWARSKLSPPSTTTSGHDDNTTRAVA
jgi:hypothetical protein